MKEKKFSQIRDLIINGNTEDGLKLLISNSKDSGFENILLVIQTEFVRIKKDHLQGIFFDETRINNINARIFGVISELEKAEDSKSEQLSESSRILIYEVEKIKQKFYTKKWNEKALDKLFVFNETLDNNVSLHIFDFLITLSNRARDEMPYSIAIKIEQLIIALFPNEEKVQEDAVTICSNIGFGILYDAIIYLKNPKILAVGLNILKYLYVKSPTNKEIILEKYVEIEHEIKCRLFKDDKYFTIISIFKNDLDNPRLAYPIFPDDLYKMIFGEDRENYLLLEE